LKWVLEPIFGAACKGIDQAGGSPAAVVVRFDCVAMHGVDERRLWSAKARANVLGAARSDSTGGLAKPRAVGDEHQIGVERFPRGNRVAGCWASRAPRRWAKAKGTNEETDKSSWCKPRRIGDGTRRMVGDLKQGRSRARKAARTSRRDEAWGGPETDGSGRSSEDAEGQHNPGGAKDPWGSGVLCRSEDRPDMPMANGIQRSSSRTSTNGASNPATGKGVSEERSVPLSWSRTGENPPYGILEGEEETRVPRVRVPTTMVGPALVSRWCASSLLDRPICNRGRWATDPRSQRTLRSHASRKRS
jgi:hypothetical protein